MFAKAIFAKKQANLNNFDTLNGRSIEILQGMPSVLSSVPDKEKRQLTAVLRKWDDYFASRNHKVEVWKIYQQLQRTMAFPNWAKLVLIGVCLHFSVGFRCHNGDEIEDLLVRC